MNLIKNMPFAGIAVIFVIAALFILAVVLLFVTYLRYKHLAYVVSSNANKDNAFLRFILTDFADAYKKYGQDVNTPAIIVNGINTKLSAMLLCERFLNNAVSLFVTLGLFGTFLGLSLSVSSLWDSVSVFISSSKSHIWGIS